jgi:hypothetical protein
VRPPRADIAVPELPTGIPWFGGPAPRMDALTAAGPVLVHFWEMAQLNSIRTLPYLRAWHERYAGHGLAVLGIHSPRYPFTAAAVTLREAVAALGLPYPVAADSEHRVWHDYGCEGWPSLFLWGRGGALRWFHFGEGEYGATEEAIQALVSEVDRAMEHPPPLEPLRPTDAPGAAVVAPSAELFPGGSVSEPWTVAEADDSLAVEYEGGGAYAAIEADGPVAVSLDGGPEHAAERITPGLWELARHERHETHELSIRPARGQRVYSVAFAPGVR